MGLFQLWRPVMLIQDIRKTAAELMVEYGEAALCIAADRAEFATDRRDFVRQKYWTDIYDIIRRLPDSKKQVSAALVDAN